MAYHIILITEDTRLGQLLARTLETETRKVTKVANIQDAFDIAEGHSPDVIILDTNKTGLDTGDTFLRLKTHVLTSSSYLIAISPLESWQPARLGDPDDHITRPFSPISLIRNVENGIRIRQSRMTRT